MIVPPCIYGGSLNYEYEYYDTIPIYDLHSHIINAHRMCSPPSLKKSVPSFQKIFRELDNHSQGTLDEFRLHVARLFVI